MVLLSCLVFDYGALGLNFGLEFFFLGFALFDFVEDYFENVSLTGVFMGLGSIDRSVFFVVGFIIVHSIWFASWKWDIARLWILCILEITDDVTMLFDKVGG